MKNLFVNSIFYIEDAILGESNCYPFTVLE